jgi:DNA-binding transcriptional MerR regulator
MFKIGDFSKLSQVTVKALRYYDEVGLLRPVYVDDFTGYRYYSLDQLPRLNRILALKDLGFSLEQIGRMLNESLPPEQIRGMLRLKQAELQQRVQGEQARLERIEARLRQIEQEGIMTNYEVILKRVSPQLVAGVRETIPTWEQVGPTLDRNFDAVTNHVETHGGTFAGPFLDIWYNKELPSDADLDVEAVAPIQSPVPETDRVKVHTLPGVETVASTIHHGPFATLGQAHGAVMQWAEANGYKIVGPDREIYLQYKRGGDQNDYITEIQYPVARM